MTLYMICLQKRFFHLPFIINVVFSKIKLFCNVTASVLVYM